MFIVIHSCINYLKEWTPLLFSGWLAKNIGAVDREFYHCPDYRVWALQERGLAIYGLGLPR